MPIKPVDFQIMIPRTVEASKNQNDAMSKLAAVNKLQNVSLQNEAELSLKQVRHKEKLFKADIKERQQKQNSDKKEKNEKEEEKKDNANKHIDIRI